VISLVMFSKLFSDVLLVLLCFGKKYMKDIFVCCGIVIVFVKYIFVT